MATSSDALLLRAMTQFGGGLGSMMGRRRQSKRDQELAEQLAPTTTPEDFISPQNQALIGAMSGVVPGSAPGGGMGMGPMAGAAAQQMSDQSNQNSELMRSLLSDPRSAAMVRQGLAQSQMASMMPKEPKPPISLGNGKAAVFNQQTGSYDIKDLGRDKDPSKRFQEVDWGTGKAVIDTWAEVDKNTGMPKAVWQGESADTRLVTRGVPGSNFGRQQVLVNEATGEEIQAYEPYTTRQEVVSRDAADMTTTTLGATQKEIMSLEKAAVAQDNLWQHYDKRFLTIPDKAWRWMQEKIDKSGVEQILNKQVLSEESWKMYEKAALFKSNTWKSVNQYIKDITGAQMSEKEVPRILKSVADTADSPREFEAIMRESMRITNETHVMMLDYINSGVDGSHIPQGYEAFAGERYREYQKSYPEAEAASLARRDAVQKWGMNRIERGIMDVAGSGGGAGAGGGGGGASGGASAGLLDGMTVEVPNG